MALTNAERHARWRARHKQEMADLKAAKAPPAKPEPRVLPARLPPGVTKARKNQEVGRDAQGHRLGANLPDRLRVPDLETAKKRFAARMRDARIAAGLSQADIAFLLFGDDPDDTYRKRYINWEIGRSFMTQNVIPVFARLVKVDCNFLFENEDLAEYLDGGTYGEKK